jgi:hypothetical protein
MHVQNRQLDDSFAQLVIESHQRENAHLEARRSHRIKSIAAANPRRERAIHGDRHRYGHQLKSRPDMKTFPDSRLKKHPFVSWISRLCSSDA